MRRLIALAMLAMLAACTSLSAEGQVRDRLIEAGLKPRLASCMAGRLVAHLSSDELRRLGHAARLNDGRKIGKMTVGELVERVSAIDDPHIVKVVTRAGIGCAIAD
jgi:hypothetical protein